MLRERRAGCEGGAGKGIHADLTVVAGDCDLGLTRRNGDAERRKGDGRRRARRPACTLLAEHQDGLVGDDDADCAV